ncbi:MAG TPA: hypothetical protein DGT21_23635 [Armatimonadetes bacterium]|nr:hypothetical protein [Armatimonadota bacterium]
MRNELRTAVASVLDASPTTSDAALRKQARLSIICEFCHAPYDVLTNDDIPFAVREALYDALADVYAEFATPFFLRKLVALHAVGADLFIHEMGRVVHSTGPDNTDKKAQREYIDGRILESGIQWLRVAATSGRMWQHATYEAAMEADTTNWFLHRVQAVQDADQPEDEYEPVVANGSMAKRVTRWFRRPKGPERVAPTENEQPAQDAQGASSHPSGQPSAAKPALRREWRDAFVDTWALRGRLDPWTAQKGEVAGMEDWRRRAVQLIPCAQWLSHVPGLLLLAIAISSLLAHALGLSGPAFVDYWPSVVALAACAHMAIVFAFWPNLGRAFVPRLGAVSIVGYLALSQLASAQKLADVSPNTWLWPAAGVVAGLVAVAGYLWFGQAARRISLPLRHVAARVAHLLLLGLMHSCAIGAIGYWLLARSLPAAHDFFIVWSWAPVSLAIGIIVQTLWQRDAITEPV